MALVTLGDSHGRPRSRRRGVGCSLGIALALLALGCAGTTAPAQSRYPGELTGLEWVSTTTLDELYRKPDVDLGAYRQLVIDPVTLADPLETFDQPYSAASLESLARRCRESFARGLGERFEIVDEPGAGSLRLRVVLTELRANRPEFERGPNGEIFHDTRGVGRAAMALELRDAQSDEPLLVAADRYRGQVFNRNLHLEIPWGDAEHAFRRWSGILRRAL